MIFHSTNSEKVFEINHSAPNNIKPNQFFVPKSCQILFFKEENIFVGCDQNFKLWMMEQETSDVKYSEFKVFFTQITDTNYEFQHSDKMIKKFKNSFFFKENSRSVIYVEKLDFENFENLTPESEVDFFRLNIPNVEIQVQDMVAYQDSLNSSEKLAVMTLKGMLNLFDLRTKNLISKFKISKGIRGFSHTLAISVTKDSQKIVTSSIANSLPYIQILSSNKEGSMEKIKILDRYSFIYEGLKPGYESCFSRLSTDLEIEGYPILSFIQSRSVNKKIFVFTIFEDELVLLARDQMPSYYFNDYKSDGNRALIMIDQYLTAIKVRFRLHY